MLKVRCILPVVACLIAASPALWAETTAFYYQGVLNFQGRPVTGTYDFLFDLYPAETGGNGSGTVISMNALGVIDGKFNVVLDFGKSAFEGSERWISIAVRTNGTGNYSYMAPRQKVLAVPYSVHAATAGSATSASTATTAQSATKAETADRAIIADSATSADTAKSAQTAQLATGIAPGAVTSTAIQDGAVVAPKIPPGQVVKSVNGLSDAVSIEQGSGVSISTSGNKVTISSSTPDAWALGGNSGTTPGPNFIGTSDNKPVMIKAANVGIGTATPRTALDVVGTVTANAFAGDGSALTGVSAAQLSSGDVPLSSLDNAWKVGGNTNLATGFLGNSDARALSIGVGGSPALRLDPDGVPGKPTSADKPLLTIEGNASLNNRLLFLSAGNTNSGLAWSGVGQPFATKTPDGPALFGRRGGVLGTTDQGAESSLVWDRTGIEVPGELRARRIVATNDMNLVVTNATGNSGIKLNVAGASQPQTSTLLDIFGNTRLWNRELWLRDSTATDTGLGWYGSTKTFGTEAPEGPVLYGKQGGALGTTAVGQKTVLKWNSDGSVNIPETLNVGTNRATVLYADNSPGVAYHQPPFKTFIDGLVSSATLATTYVPAQITDGFYVVIATCEVNLPSANFIMSLASMTDGTTSEEVLTQTSAFIDTGAVTPTMTTSSTLSYVIPVTAGGPGRMLRLIGSVTIGRAEVRTRNLTVMYFPRLL